MRQTILLILATLWLAVPSFASSGEDFLGDWYVKKEIAEGFCVLSGKIHIEQLNKNIFAITDTGQVSSRYERCFSSRPVTCTYENDALRIGQVLRMTMKDDGNALFEARSGIWILTKENTKEKIKQLNDSALEAGNKGEHGKAVSYYSQVLKIDPDDRMALNNRSTEYKSLHQFQLAVEDLSRLIKIDPKNSGAYSNRSGAYSALNQPQLAIQDIDKAIEISPNDFLNYYGAAVICMRFGMYKEASSYLKQGEFHIDKKNKKLTALLFAQMAWLSSTSPDEVLLNGEDAVILSTRAIDILEPKDPSSRAYYLNIAAAAYARNNQNAEAVKTQEEAIAALKSKKNVKSETMKEYEERLELYRSGKPYTWTKKD